ncbi:MAG: NAD-dependent epimerase/dehydratase family protein, partial [Chthoniobacterales bacterium]
MSEPRNRMVLVTGAAGFIGSHLTDHLLQLGNKVVGIDNFSRGTRANLADSLLDPNFQFFERDLSNLDSLREMLSAFEVDTVWHLVANSDIGAGVADPNV